MSVPIELRNVSHFYSPGTAMQVASIKNISLTIEEGEFVGIIGHTGSGKSTLISHFNGLLKPSEGTVLVDGEDISQSKEVLRAARFKVGLCFQYPEAQLFEETVAKDIAFGPKNMKLPEDEIARRVAEADSRGFGDAPSGKHRSPQDRGGNACGSERRDADQLFRR